MNEGKGIVSGHLSFHPSICPSIHPSIQLTDSLHPKQYGSVMKRWCTTLRSFACRASRAFMPGTYILVHAVTPHVGPILSISSYVEPSWTIDEHVVNWWGIYVKSYLFRNHVWYILWKIVTRYYILAFMKTFQIAHPCWYADISVRWKLY